MSFRLFSMNDPEVYSRKWDEYHRRMKFVIVAWIIAIPGAMLTSWLLMNVLGVDLWPAGVVSLMTFGGMPIAANHYLGRWRCPACGDSFCKWFIRANPLVIRCVHCGLRRYSTDEQIDQHSQTLNSAER